MPELVGTSAVDVPEPLAAWLESAAGDELSIRLAEPRRRCYVVVDVSPDLRGRFGYVSTTASAAGRDRTGADLGGHRDPKPRRQ